MPIPFTCPHCGKQTLVSQEYLGRSGPCAGCGQTVTIGNSGSPFEPSPAPHDVGDDPAMRLLLPVGRSALAILAGYAALFAVLIFPAPIALILGILAFRDIKRHPEKHGMGRAVFALVMGGIFSALLLLFLVIAAAGV